MKKVLFCLSLIISLSVLGVVPSFAMDFVIDPATIGSIGDLGYGLAGGMELDFDNSFISEKYKGQYESEGTSQGKRLVAKQAAYDFITNYAISRGLPLPSNASDYVDNLPTDTYSYFKSVYFDNQVRSITNKAKLAGNDQALYTDAMRFGIGPSAFADWADYSQFWYKVYVDQIGEGEYEEVQTPNLPSAYSWLSNINELYCRNHNLFTYSGSFNTQPNLSLINTTVIDNDLRDYRNYSNDSAVVMWNYSPLMTISVASNTDGTVSVSYSISPYVSFVSNWASCTFAINSAGTNAFLYQYSNDYVSYKQSTFDNLNDALNYIYRHYSNIDLYVNGDFWIKSDGSIDRAPANPIIPSFPDVIDPTSDNPAYTIDLPATNTGEGYFDITSLFDALVDAIEGALDDDPTTDTTLDGTKGLEFEDEAGDAVNDDPIPDDDVIDDSIPDPTGLPNIPVPLPPIQDAFSGTTVLAELIHATDIVMPDDLMAVFWGIVFILFIIGLIKVLHK